MDLQLLVQLHADRLCLPCELIHKLIHFIDCQKIQGAVGGYASSKFADYLGFLRLPDDDNMREFFADRWSDDRVRIEVPKNYMKFLSNEAPLFTPSRLEPQYNKIPFYDAGIEKVPTGRNTNLHDHGTVRKPPPLREAYQNFIIDQYLPKQFYIELRNEVIPTALSAGLPKVTFEEPYPLHLTADEARHGLNKLLHKELHRIASRSDLMRFTLVRLDTSKMNITNETFFTRNDLEAGSARAGGYFYIDEVKPNALKIAEENIA